jgi:monoamine oxidase
MAPALKTLRLTRRHAIGGLVSALSCPALAGPRREPDFDVLIIGAGAAGIAAGRRLLVANKKFAILEASDRMGGRCFTDTATFNLPYDRGACSIHLPPQSSLAKLAAQNGTELYPDPQRQQFRLRGRNGLEKHLEENRSKLELEEFYAERVRCYAAIAQAAAGKDDTSCAKALPADLGDWRRIMEFVLGPYRFGAELSELSAKEYAVSIDRGAAQLCRQGVGAVFGKLALGVPIKFFSPVTLVDWGERSVALAIGEGVVTARAVIVTASTAVLASGRIRFSPNLPERYASAFEKLKLGSYDHVTLAFNGNPLGLDANEVVFERGYTTKTAALLANVHGTRLSLLTLAGRSGAELADKGENAMTDFALDWISGVFGSRAKKAVLRVHAASWNKDPWTLGAFSSAPPGAQEARKALSEPLKDVVWFAGEAVHQTFWGTVGGAWQNGERVADAVIARLDHKPPRSAGG